MSKQSLFTLKLASAVFAFAGLLSAQPVLADAKTSKIELTGWTATGQASQHTGRQSAAAPCKEGESREWSELLANRVKTELNAVFTEEMQIANASAQQPQAVRVSAELEDIDLQVCNFGGGSWTGQMNVRLTWKSVVTNDAKAPHLVTTTGSYAQTTPAHTSGSQALKEALRMAVRKLAKDEGFAALSGQSKSIQLALVN